MTRNLFVGTDLGPVFAAQSFPELVAATTTAFGLTCCWETHLLSPVPPFDQRIDLVLHRGPFRALAAEIVGEDPVADRTASGLFHSDHAGVVARLRLGR